MKLLSTVTFLAVWSCLGISSLAHGQAPSPSYAPLNPGQTAPPAAPGTYPAYPPPSYPPAPAYRPPPPYYPAGNVWMPPPQGVHTHDGTYLRLQLGFGYNNMSASAPGIDEELSGTGGAFLFAVGAAVTRNLVIYGALADSIATNPDIKVNGQLFATGTGKSSAGVVGLGPGLAYYLDDSNIYFSGTLLFSKLSIDGSDGDTIAQSDWGFTLEGQLGKEWWVSDNWGLGGAFQAMWGKMKDKPVAGATDTPTWSFASFSLLFSATYN